MQVGMSRRTLVRAATGLLALATGQRAAAGQAISQQAAEYQLTPKETQMCGTCSLFIRPDGCRVVEGPVARQGWCKLYDPVD